MFESKDTKDAVPELPGDFRATGKLKIGLKFGGATHRDFAVGPLDLDAQIRADLEKPDGLDDDLMYRASVWAVSDEDLAKEKIDKSKVKEPTAAEKAKANAMASAEYRHYCRYRVTKLGGIPRPMIADAVKKMIPKDFGIIAQACEGVDEQVDNFRDEDDGDLATGPGSGKGGGSAGSSDNGGL